MVKTTNISTDLLDESINQSGLKVGFIVDKLGLSRQAFDRKRKGEIAFRQSEVYVLCDLLKLDASKGKEIFFPEMLGDKQT